MRFVAAVLLWLSTTAALAVAVPAVWAQRNIVDADGYAAMAQKAAADPAVQAAVASQLAAEACLLVREHGSRADPGLVRDLATAYTGGPSFSPQFVQANRIAHGWAFAGTEPGPDPWVIDLAPLLNDSSFRQTLADNDIHIPAVTAVPLTVSAPKSLRPGQLHPLAIWGPWVSLGATVLAGGGAVLTLAAARRRGKALASLGVAALLVAAVGYAGIEVGRRRIDDVLNRTGGDTRRIAEALLGSAEASLHHWLNVILAAGGALVALGVLVAILGGLRRR
ncbi:hypothetical protein BMW24_002350 [Mycobacterium heckeshornense]|uniref:Uncharacterized protein n=1 Tax=Mycobacterium heckeshornense TaxID=110505 RepID=A0A2G8BK11_9MYCO|nr:hypothetical protein [Mycobacterium heckeshornense]KMV24422.1 hypothetical protein ACT16_00635 [Mycobacterium heckeshornense]MCV7035486.1 hypothetical protein [Mycobacterium heckeshornense]PIJ37946.1 hypothetical protein BMW24_002350 [Mycobacterium heckeshornense]BCO37918.1 hypothetical protein MHEC_43510 [Mycobacterium heckeshornense]